MDPFFHLYGTHVPGPALQALSEMRVVAIPQAKPGPIKSGWDVQALEAVAVRLLG